MANIKGILKKLFVIGLTGAMLLSTATACGGGGDSTGGGGSTTEDWSEGEIDEIELFCNDWEQFNNAKAVKCPIYKQLVKAAGCDFKAVSTAS